MSAITETRPTDPIVAPEPGAPDRALGPLAGAHIPALDGVRGLAVLMVMLMHFCEQQTPTSALGKFLHHTMQVGWIGVDLFFVLSGFLITGILMDAKGSPGY